MSVPAKRRCEEDQESDEFGPVPIGEGDDKPSGRVYNQASFTGDVAWSTIIDLLDAQLAPTTQETVKQFIELVRNNSRRVQIMTAIQSVWNTTYEYVPSADRRHGTSFQEGTFASRIGKRITVETAHAMPLAVAPKPLMSLTFQPSDAFGPLAKKVAEGKLVLTMPALATHLKCTRDTSVTEWDRWNDTFKTFRKDDNNNTTAAVFSEFIGRYGKVMHALYWQPAMSDLKESWTLRVNKNSKEFFMGSFGKDMTLNDTQYDRIIYDVHTLKEQPPSDKEKNCHMVVFGNVKEWRHVRQHFTENKIWVKSGPEKHNGDHAVSNKAVANWKEMTIDAWESYLANSAGPRRAFASYCKTKYKYAHGTEEAKTIVNAFINQLGIKPYSITGYMSWNGEQGKWIEVKEEEKAYTPEIQVNEEDNSI